MTEPTPRMDAPKPLVFVTGPSGAGRSTAIKVFEDLGFEAIDNMPLSLLPRLLNGEAPERPVALGVDVRNRDFSTDGLLEIIAGLTENPGMVVQVLYLDAGESTLVRRYSETRRRHPLAPDDAPLVGIALEQKMLEPIRSRADHLVDTSDLSPHDLRDEITRSFGTDDGRVLGLSVHSFSYKRGLPRGLDMVFDCRFLRNPHWEADLRAKDGRDNAVAAYVMNDPLFGQFFIQTKGLIETLLPAFQAEGKSHLSIGFGCTGGQHRSVALTEHVAFALAEMGWHVSKRHRELERRASVDAASVKEHTT